MPRQKPKSAPLSWRDMLSAWMTHDAADSMLYVGRPDSRMIEFEHITGSLIAQSATDNRVHNWATHVPEEIVQSWDSLPMEARVCVMFLCNDLAHQEEWE